MNYSSIVQTAMGLLLSLLTVPANFGAAPPNWPQFRGPNGLGTADTQHPPVDFDGERNALWKIAMPPGASSPCIWGDRMFLTAFEGEQLQTLCIRRADGTVLWKKAAPPERLERFHPQEGSPAAATPVSDGDRVYVYFGSCGLLCYDFDGVEQWRHPLPPLESFGGFGSGASPVLAGGLILLNRDQVGVSRLVAVEAATGKGAWTVDRGRSYSWCSPFVWEHDGVQEVVLPASSLLMSYDLKTGAERWRIRGIAAATCSTPIASDGLLFVSSWSPSDTANAPPPFGAVLDKSDKDGDGAISFEETNGTDLRMMFQTFDLNRDQRIARDEYESLRTLARQSKNALLAVRPGGQGDVTDSHVAWRADKGLPYVPSPLAYRGRLYLVKDGGMVSCFESASGRPLYMQERLGSGGNYYASPVAADGRIYAASVSGVITVFGAGDTLKILAKNDLGERISATPAIADDTLYVRTASHLFAFKEKSVPAAAGAEVSPAIDETVLFDGKSLAGWRISDFTGSGKVQVEDGKVTLKLGYMTGITWTNDLPRMNYEISLEAMRLEGSDFFCGLTFPVGETSCSLIAGGWGGNLVGLSSLDYADAANNETTRFIQFENGRWYQIRLRVEPGRIRAWIDKEQVADVNTTDRKISIRPECEPSLPMGIATYATTAALRNIKLRSFSD